MQVNYYTLMKLYLIGNIRKLKFTPSVGLEPTTRGARTHDPEIKSLILYRLS